MGDEHPEIFINRCENWWAGGLVTSATKSEAEVQVHPMESLRQDPEVRLGVRFRERNLGPNIKKWDSSWG